MCSMARRWKGGGRLRQKGVDVLLATHMLTHVFRKNAKHVKLLAGDADFAPLVRALVMEGAYVTVWYARGSGSADLLEAADASDILAPHYAMTHTVGSFKDRHPAPNIYNSAGPSNHNMVHKKRGRTPHGEANLYHLDRWLLVAPSPDYPGQFTHIFYEDMEGLEHMADAYGITVTWDQ
jgi:hypothetical protein